MSKDETRLNSNIIDVETAVLEQTKILLLILEELRKLTTEKEVNNHE